MNFFGYLLLCILQGFTCAKMGLELSDKEYWILLLCTFGAYICGACQ